MTDTFTFTRPVEKCWTPWKFLHGYKLVLLELWHLYVIWKLRFFFYSECF